MCGSRSSGRARGALLGDVREPAVGEQFLPPAHLVPQPPEQPDRALRLGAADDGAAVRQVGERQQRAVAAVDPVHVHVRAAVVERERPGDRAQQLRPPGSAAPRRPSGG